MLRGVTQKLSINGNYKIFINFFIIVSLMSVYEQQNCMNKSLGEVCRYHR